jgi:cation diffusion facilitator CzcD-associated flavoprotein CzcO/SAM-dependent methyltransferase
MEEIDVVVVGAGQAGIALSFYLKQLGVNHLVLERDLPFSSWRNRWDGFQVNTPNWMNTLPFGGDGTYPSGDPNGFATREEMVEYLDRCLEAVNPPLKTGAEVLSVTTLNGGHAWETKALDAVYRSKAVAICSGAMSTPRIPAGAAGIPDSVPQLHSQGFRSADQIQTGSVLVVGTASSGVQIGKTLCESGKFERVHFAASRVLLLPRRILGMPTHRFVHFLGFFDIRKDSLLGKLIYASLETRGDPIMRPTPKDLRSLHGNVEMHGRFAHADETAVYFEDDSSIPLDDLTIIWCTGFRPSYDFVDFPGRDAAFDASGSPRHVRGVVDAAAGLFFVGLRHQYTVASHDIYGVAKDAEFTASRIKEHLVAEPRDSLELVAVRCSVCDGARSKLIATGYDFEYRTAPDLFRAFQCGECRSVFLNPRPDVSEFTRIYPSSYHSLAFSEENFSFVHKIRSRLEANRLLRYCDGIPDDARILDVGCGDGFHLRLLRRFGKESWRLEGVDIDSRAVDVAAKDGLTIHQGTLEHMDLPENHYDVVYTLQTIEHVADPFAMLTAIRRVLKPGGRLVIVTDNVGSIDFRLFSKRYWGGYHFPRHWNLFTREALERLAIRAGLETERIETIVSPVNWVYSIHNWLVGRGAPQWLINRFTLKSPISLGVFTMVDTVLQRLGRGALLNAFFRKPQQ